MGDVRTADLLQKMYQEILTMRKDLDEIRSVLILEDDVLEDEQALIEEGMKAISSGSHRSWREIKKELE